MKKINLNPLIEEVVKTNKKVDKINSSNNVKKDKTTLADMVSNDMVKNIKKYKES